MARWIRSTLPVTEEMLVTRWPNLKEFQKVDESFKQKQKKTLTVGIEPRNCQVLILINLCFVATREGTDFISR